MFCFAQVSRADLSPDNGAAVTVPQGNGSAVVDISKLDTGKVTDKDDAAVSPTKPSEIAKTNGKTAPVAKEKKSKDHKKANTATEASTSGNATVAVPDATSETSKTGAEPSKKEKKDKKKRKSDATVPLEPQTEASESAAPVPETAPATTDKKSKKKRKSEADTALQANGAADAMEVDEPVATDSKKDKSPKKKRKAVEETNTDPSTSETAPVVGGDAADKPSKPKKSRKSATGSTGPPAVSDVDPDLIKAAAESAKSIFSMNGLVKRGSDISAYLKEEWSTSEDPSLRSAAVAEGVTQRALLQAIKITKSSKGLSVAFEA